MPITTLDGAVAGARPPIQFVKGPTGTMVAGRPHSLFQAAGTPGAAAASVAGVNGEALTGYPGQLPFLNPVSGETYLSKLTASATVAGLLLLCDRLWHNSGLSVTATTSQPIVTPAFPSRDADGFAAGSQVQLGLEVTGTLGAGTPTITVGYTNSTGVAGRSGVNIDPVVAASIAGSFYRIGLQAGDVGVRSVESLQLSATMTSGSVSLVAYRVLAAIPLPGALVPSSIDALTGNFPKLYNNSVPFLVFVPAAATTSIITGELGYAQG